MIEVVQEGIVERCQAKHPERAMQCDHFADHFGSHQHAISPTECARWPSEDDVEDAHAVAEIEAMTDEECEAYLVDEEQGITREVVRDWGRGAAVFAKAMVAAKQKCEALALENSRLVDVDIRLGSAEQTLAQVSEERDSLRRAVEEYLPQPNGDAQRRGDPDAWNAAMFNLGNLKKEADTARAEAEQLRSQLEGAKELAEVRNGERNRAVAEAGTLRDEAERFRAERDSLRMQVDALQLELEEQSHDALEQHIALGNLERFATVAYLLDRAEQYDASSGYRAFVDELVAGYARSEHLESSNAGEYDDMMERVERLLARTTKGDAGK